MTSRPCISVVVPNYNYSKFLGRFFSCLARQSVGLRQLEVIAVDDGSDDDSLEVFAGWRERLGAARFQIVALQHSGSPARVRNAGFSRASGEFIIGLDPDDEFSPALLGVCLKTLHARQDAGFAYTDWLVRREGRVRMVSAPEYDAGLLRTQNPWTSAVLMRRRVWDDSEGFRENTAYEDWDFWIQAAANGFCGVRAPGAHFTYDMHGQSFSSRARAEDARAKAAIVMNNKRFFHPSVATWARGVLRGAPWAGAMGRGLIPRPGDVERIMAAAQAVMTAQAGIVEEGRRG